MDRHPILGPVELIPVTDADEEVFLLYTALTAAPALSTGLGFVNSREDRLTVEFDLPVPARAKGKRKAAPETESVCIELAQDVTSLRTRKGDTGSVLWRASVFLARMVLTQHRLPRNDEMPALFSRDGLAQSTVLELGAGTGLLATALGPLAASYVATDLDFLVPLMRKNLALNDAPPSVRAEALDWAYLPAKRDGPENVLLVLAVDTLYNPALIPAFVAALDHYTRDGACAVVVCELRSEDVVREFLEAWLASGAWEIGRVGSGLFDLPFVAWVARQSQQ